jgi:hypothetical protein
MGAHKFETTAFGKTVEEAYIHACNEATWGCGHDPYNGTISTTQGFVVITPKPRRQTWKVVKEYMNIKDGIIEKWGKCGAIILKGKEAKQYRESHNLVGKKGLVVLFFGWAAS